MMPSTPKTPIDPEELKKLFELLDSHKLRAEKIYFQCDDCNAVLVNVLEHDPVECLLMQVLHS
jgi:hypothetical protein